MMQRWREREKSGVMEATGARGWGRGGRGGQSRRIGANSQTDKNAECLYPPFHFLGGGGGGGPVKSSPANECSERTRR